MRRHKQAQDNHIRAYLDWQDLFGAIHLRCPHPDRHVDGDQHPSAFVYPNGIYCFGCGWGTGDIGEACKIYFGWDKKKTRKRLYNYLATHPPRGDKLRHATPVPLKVIRKWMDMRKPQDVQFLCNHYAITPHYLNTACIGYTGKAFSIPHIGLDGRVWAVKFRRDDRGRALPKHWSLESTLPKYWSLENRGYHYIYPAFAVWSYVKQEKPKRILLCEGEFDALAALSHDYPAVAVPSGSGTKLATWAWFWRELTGHTTIYLAYDMDKAGAYATQQAFKYFTKNHPGLLVIRAKWEGGKDVAELLRQGGKIL